MSCNEPAQAAATDAPHAAATAVPPPPPSKLPPPCTSSSIRPPAFAGAWEVPALLAETLVAGGVRPVAFLPLSRTPAKLKWSSPKSHSKTNEGHKCPPSPPPRHKAEADAFLSGELSKAGERFQRPPASVTMTIRAACKRCR